jgi:hypothetical protein
MLLVFFAGLVNVLASNYTLRAFRLLGQFVRNAVRRNSDEYFPPEGRIGSPLKYFIKSATLSGKRLLKSLIYKEDHAHNLFEASMEINCF